jgi:hypothetical protein
MLVHTSVRDLLRKLITTCEFTDFLAMHTKIRENNVHAQLQYDLVEHLDLAQLLVRWLWNSALAKNAYVILVTM